MACFDGQTIVFTGGLDTMTRDRAQELSRKNGAKTASTVTKDATLVVAGKDAGGKLAKAREQGVRVCTEDEWLKMMGKTRADVAECRSEPEIMADLRDKLDAL